MDNKEKSEKMASRKGQKRSRVAQEEFKIRSFFKNTPQELWPEKYKFLNVQDLVNLALTNKEVMTSILIYLEEKNRDCKKQTQDYNFLRCIASPCLDTCVQKGCFEFVSFLRDAVQEGHSPFLVVGETLEGQRLFANRLTQTAIHSQLLTPVPVHNGIFELFDYRLDLDVETGCNMTLNRVVGERRLWAFINDEKILLHEVRFSNLEGFCAGFQQIASSQPCRFDVVFNASFPLSLLNTRVVVFLGSGSSKNRIGVGECYRAAAGRTFVRVVLKVYPSSLRNIKTL